MDELERSGIYGPEFKGGTVEYGTVRFLHALGRVVRLHKLYPPDNPYVQGAVEDAYLAYDTLMGLVPGVSLAFYGGGVKVENTRLPKIPEQIGPVLEILEAHGVESVLLLPGAEVRELASFSRLLASRPGQPSPADAAHRTFADIPNIQATLKPYQPPAGERTPVGVMTGEDERRLMNLLLGPPDEIIHGSSDLLDSQLDGNLKALGSILARVIGMGAATQTGGNLKAAAVRVFDGVLGRLVIGRRAALDEVFEKVIKIVTGMDKPLAEKILTSTQALGADLSSVLVSSLRDDLRSQALINSLDKGASQLLAESFSRACQGPADMVRILGNMSSLLKERGTAFPQAAGHVAAALKLAADAAETEIAQSAAGKTGDFFTLSEINAPATTALVAHSRGSALQFLTDVFKRAGFSTISCPEGKSAMKAMLENKPAIAVIDLGLAGTHGLDIIRMIKVKNVTPPLIITSEHPEFARDFEVKTYPSYKFIPSPIGEQELVSAINELTAKHGIQILAHTLAKSPAVKVLKAKKYLLRGRGGEAKASGFEVSVFHKVQKGEGFVHADFFPAGGCSTGVLMTGRDDYNDGLALRARMLQCAAWMVSPWLTSARDIMIQSAALLGPEMFGKHSLAAATAVLDPSEGKISTASAGFPPPIIVDPGRADVVPLAASESLLGGSPSGGFGKLIREDGITLPRNCVFIMLSPGVLNAAGRKGDKSGWEFLKGVILTSASLAPSDIMSSIERELDKFAFGQQQQSDFMGIAAAYKGDNS